MTVRSRLRTAALASMPLLALAGTAAAQETERGHQLARRWCAGCHIVEATAVEGKADGVPTFPSIAARPGLSSDELRAAINPLHGRMPDLSLAKRDQDDLIAYIKSLRPR